jgi:rhamnosyltransferase
MVLINYFVRGSSFLSKKEIFIIGAKGIPAKYGGFETFVDQLTARKKSNDIHYNVACRRDLSDNKSDFFEYNGANCFNVDVPDVGPAKAILYDVNAFKKSLEQIKERKIKEPIVYVLACRMGPFISHFKKELEKYNGTLYINPDGHEWLRAKWSYPVRKYWKYSERLMVKSADLLICDSKNIEVYIQADYARYSPKTTYIAYGSDLTKSTLAKTDEVVLSWYDKKDVKLNNYYLIVGRFVPENNYETMIKEFMKSNTDKDLVIITNVEKNKFYESLLKETGFDKDKRIKFVGTVYNQELLKFIRENAYGYIHGHEVGGTNPSLLEALSSTKINLLLDVGFNREVGDAGALYWSKKDGSLSALIDTCDRESDRFISKLNDLSNLRIKEFYSWNLIENNYEKIW